MQDSSLRRKRIGNWSQPKTCLWLLHKKLMSQLALKNMSFPKRSSKLLLTKTDKRRRKLPVKEAF